MKKIKSIVLLFCSGWLNYSEIQALTSKDLTASYHNEKAQITDLQNKIAPIKDSIKNKWTTTLASVSTIVDSIYNKAASQIRPLEPQLKSTNISQKIAATERINTLIVTAQQNMNSAVSPVIIDISQELLAYQQQQGSKQPDLSPEIQQEIELQKAQAAYRKKIEPHIIELSQLLVPFEQVQQDTQQFVLQNYGKPYNPAQVEKIVKSWQGVIAKAFSIYKKLGDIDVHDSSSLLIAALTNLGNFLLDRVVVQLTPLQRQKVDDAYYKVLSNISVQFLGTQNANDSMLVGQGYDAVVKNEIAKYFSDVNQQAVLYNAYVQRKIDITYNLYKNALQTLANTIPNPTDAQLSYAVSMYKLLMSILAEIPADDKKAINDTVLINQSMALLYVSSAQAVLKTVQMNQDNTALVKKIIALYQQAAFYFSQAKDGGQAQTYTNLATNLSQALSALAQATLGQRSGGDQSKTIELYKQAYDYFLQGSDLVDANKVSITLADLQGQQSLVTVSNSLIKFFSDNKALIEAYIAYCTTLNSSATIDHFTPLFTKLVQLYQSAYATYDEALKSYQGVITNNPTLKKSANIQQSIQNLSAATTLLTTVSQAQDTLNKGDFYLQLKTVDALQETESRYYSVARNLFSSVDGMYKNNQLLITLVPPFFAQVASSVPLTFELLSQLHSAKLEIELANTITDPATALSFYNSANTRFALLPASFQKYLTDKRNELSQTKTNVDTLFEQAQSTQKALLALSQDAWQPTNEQGVYTSDAVSKWETLLQQYISVYHLGKQEAKDAFIEALQEYSQNYKKYVPEVYFSEIGLAMIAYQQFILHTNESETADAATVMNDIKQLLTTSFGAAQALVSSVANAATLVTTASTNQAAIINWADRLDQALTQQDQIIATIGTSITTNQKASLLLFTKTIKEKTIEYAYVPLNKVIDITDPRQKLAELYKQLGDYYFKQKKYDSAYFSYSNARTLYTAENNADAVASFSAQLALANTLYLAARYRDAIIPKNEVTIQTFKVPQSYELQVYSQKVPSVISDQFPNLDFLKSDEKKTTDFLVGLAIKLYLYHKINYLFGQDQFDALYSLLGLTFDQLQANPTFQALSDNQKVAFVTMVSFASQLNTELRDRLSKKQSNFALQQNQNKEYVLYEYSIPIPRLNDPAVDMDYQNYYAGYPAVMEYYFWAATLFKPGKPDETISIGQLNLPPGNDQDSYNAMVMAQIDTYLSHGYSYQAQLNSLIKTNSWSSLLKVDRSDMSVSFDTYADLYAQVNELYNGMIYNYNAPVAAKLVDSGSPEYVQLNTLLGQTYKVWGDTLATFLIGDPLSHNYSSVLKDILGHYIIAITTYKYDSKIYADLAKHYNDAGNILIAQEKYFDSLSFFYSAALFLRRVTPQSAALTKIIDGYYSRYLASMYKGSTLKMGSYHDYTTQPITITLQDGTKETLTFKQLLKRYLDFFSQTGGASTVGLDPAEKSMVETIKDLLLDALIYYNGCNSLIFEGITSANVPSLMQDWLSIDDKTIDKVTDQALDLINSFTEKNKVSFDSLSSVTHAMSRTDFHDGKNFVEMLNAGFDQFAQHIQNASSSFNRAVGYAAIGKFALKLYEGFSYIFMNDYASGISVDAEQQLKAAIQARVNEIVTPPDQVIG